MKSTDIESEICICVKIESEIKELKMKSAVNFYLEIFLFLAKKFEQKCYKWLQLDSNPQPLSS